MKGRQTQWPRRLGALVYVGLVAAPLLALLGAALSGLSAGRWDWLALALPQGRRLGLLAQSFGLAAGVAAGGMFVGLLVALQLWQWRSPVASRLRWAFLLLAPLPPAIHALAWSNLAATFNQFLRHQGLAELPFRGWGASWWVQVMALLPIAIGLALVGLESVDSDLVEAGRLLQPDLRSLARVSLPLAAPALLAGGALLFLLSLVDYAIPSLYQVNVYALEIFADFSANNQAGRALILALPLLAATVAAISLAQSRLRPAALDPSWRQRFPSVPPRWPFWFAILQRLALLILLVQALVPLGSLIALTGSWAQFRAALEPAGSEIRFSLGVALLTGLLCLIPAAALARSALRRGRSGWLWWLAMTVPLAVPAPLVGIGLIAVWNRPVGVGVYGTWMMPVLAALARFTPLAAVIIAASMRRLNPTLIEAARLLESNRWRTWLLVQLPLLAPGLLAAAGLVICLTLGELGATLLVVPPGQATLTLRIYNFLHYGASDTVAGLSLVLTLLVLFCSGLAALALAGWNRLAGNGARP